ncbi:MAG: cadherin-like domain-containing protein, partial [Desulfobacterales bacterium]|nr:cadherin-like domain-containing protein [Desulfobacterales bacterium]
MEIDDFDYLIPESQRTGFYEEDLNVSVTFENTTPVDTMIDFGFVGNLFSGETELFRATFTPDAIHAGDYNLTVEVTDNSGLSDVVYIELTIGEVNDAPNLTFIPDQVTTSKRVFYLDVNATDEEDSPSLPESGVLNYKLNNLTVGGDFLKINLTSGVINISMNESLAGVYQYNLSVNDSLGLIDSQIFELRVYGSPNITWPDSGTVFNWVENRTEENLDFEVDYAINDTNMTYNFYLDRIVYTNATDYYVTPINESLRRAINYTWTFENNLTINFTPDFSDESYGNFKSFVLEVFNREFPELIDNVTWNVDVLHANEPINFYEEIPDKGPLGVGTSFTIDLSEHFSDADYFDKAINQRVDMAVVTSEGSTNNIETASSFSGWNLTLTSSVP